MACPLGNSDTIGTDRSLPSASTPSTAARWHVGYSLFVALAVVTLKLWVAQDIKASAFFADDYLYLNQSPYYLRGDVAMESYPHGQVYAGVVYPLVLSPWLLADDPAQRIYIVHAINILLSGVTVFFGSRIVARLSNSSHLLPSLCLAAMPTLVIFSFHAMTENLVFAMFTLVGWLVIDFEDTCRQPKRLLGLLFLVMLLPQVRAPGIAVVPGLVLLVWLHRRHLGRRRAWLIVAGLLSAPLAPYLVFAAAAPPYRSHAREFYYFEILSRFANEPVNYGLRTLRLVGNQVAYLLVGSGYWILPVLLTVAVQVRRWAPGVHRDRWRDYLLFSGTSSLMVLAFCVWHLLIVIRRDLRLHGSFEPGLIYGRYNDPAMLLILIGGLASVLVLQRPRWEGVLPCVVAPIGLYLSLRIITPQKWIISSQQTGLVWFEGAWNGPTLFLLGVAGAVALLFLTPGQRWRAPVWMGALLVYFVIADAKAVGTTDSPGSMRRRAATIAHTQEAAE